MVETNNGKIKYIIMCGGDYKKWQTPRQLTKFYGESLVERTIRLLRECGVQDISISSNNPVFEQFGVPVLKHDNLYIANGIGNVQGDWFNAFYPTDEPTCYIFGDVLFSKNAIRKIVETKVDDIELFGSQQPFHELYIKTHVEPFALKVMNTDHLKQAIKKTREMDQKHLFWRKPIVWELFTVIKNAPLQKTLDQYTTDYTVINDYTCDIDNEQDIKSLKERIGDVEMIKCEVIEQFTLERYDEIKDSIERVSVDTPGKLYIGDKFTCAKELADYLMGNNAKNKTVVKIIEIIPPKEPQVETTVSGSDITTTNTPLPKSTYRYVSKKTTKKTKK